MVNQILDGMGKGTRCSVSDDNRLDVSARMADRIYYFSRNGRAFALDFHGQMATGGTEEPLGYIKYTGDEKLVIDRIIFSSQEPGDGLTAFCIHISPTTYSGGSAVTPVNLNLSSNKDIDNTSVHNNNGADVVIAIGGTCIYPAYIKGPGTVIVNTPGLMLSTNTAISLHMNAATTTTKVTGNVFCWEEDR